MNIIIFGEMGSGKSTVANYLVKNYEYTKGSLGAKIHSECNLHGKETREEMQRYGQMMRKIFGENTWCDYLYKKFKYKGIFDKIVIDDARQLNEYDYFMKKGFLPIAIITEDSIRLDRLQKRVNYKINPETFEHETEKQARECIKKCDIKIYNNSTEKDLYREIESKLKEYIC